MSTVGFEELAAVCKAIMHGVAWDGTGRALARAVLFLEQDGWSAVAVDQSRADDADDTRVPVGVCKHDGPSCGSGHAGGLGHLDGLGENLPLGLLASCIQRIEFGCDFLGAFTVGGGEQFDRVEGMAPCDRRH